MTRSNDKPIHLTKPSGTTSDLVEIRRVHASFPGTHLTRPH